LKTTKAEESESASGHRGGVQPDPDRSKAAWSRQAWLQRLSVTAGSRERLTRYVTITWLVILVVLVGWVIFRGRDDFINSLDELLSASPSWLAIAIIIQVMMLVFSGLAYQLILKRLGYKVGLLRMVDAHMQRTTISTVTPGGGPASIFIFSRYVAKHGVPHEDGLLTIAVRAVAVAITFIAVLIPGAALGDSRAGGIIAAVGIVLLTIGGIALWKGEQDEWATPLRWSEKLPGWVASRFQGFIIRFRDHGLRPVDLVPAIVLSLLVRVTIVGVLFACLSALGEEPTFNMMINTYFASIVASTAIPIFGGAGAVEAVSILSLTRAGVPNEIAIGAVLLWRLIDLWIPVGIGLILHARTELPASPKMNTGNQRMTSPRDSSPPLDG
jgi:uncharacterized protein (TIRG00374 family)